LKAVEKTEEKAVEICPLCGSKMERGFLVTRLLSWSDKKHKVSAWEGEIIAKEGWSLANIDAYRCKKCKLVVFRYGETGNLVNGDKHGE
jgi:hypothetical protein